MAVKYRFKGHESFILRDGWLTKGLVAVKEDPLVFTRNKGADALGVGTNMANSIKYWLTAGELIKSVQGSGYQLTPLGEIIYENDRYFEDIFSLWLFHIHMVRNFQMATTWNVFFNDFDASTFTRKTFLRTMVEKCYEATSADSLPEASIENDCGCILAMYSDGREDAEDPEDKKISPFSVLGLLAQDKNSYEKKRPSLENVDDLLILYSIADKFVKGDKNSKDSLTIDQIVSAPNMPGRLFNLNRLAINDALDRLADKGYITVNRTAGLDMVYRESKIDQLDIVRKHYSV